MDCQKLLPLLELFEISNSWQSLRTFLKKITWFQYKTSSFFTFHHANAFEKDGNLVVDYCRYGEQEMGNCQIKNLWNFRMRKPDIFQAYSLENMRKGNFLNTDVSRIFWALLFFLSFESNILLGNLEIHVAKLWD